MGHRFLASLGTLAAMIASASLLATPVAAQAPARATAAKSAAARTPWGDPNLQGIWTTNEMHAVPLERPAELAGKTVLTDEAAAARREETTQATVTAEKIGNYDRAFRDTALGFTKQKPSTQASLIIDPPDGKLPPMTPERQKRVAAGRAGQRAGSRPASWEDLTPWNRCITRGVETIVMPSGYNNGVQIVQGPGYVAIVKEMIHETRVVPLDRRPHLSSDLTLLAGDARGHWEGETLVVDVTNFNGKAPLNGAGKNLHIVERFTRIGSDQIEYRYTVEDPTIWTRPWTGRMTMSKDDSQYELVEYACHEANYSMSNTLSGARAEEKAEAEGARKQQ